MSSVKELKVDLPADGPVGSVGGRSPTMLSTGQVETPGAGGLAPGQRSCAARKRNVVLRLMRDEPTELLARELRVPLYRLVRWRERAQAAMDSALKERETDADSTELAAAMQRNGELAIENELLRAWIGQSGPLTRRRSR